MKGNAISLHKSDDKERHSTLIAESSFRQYQALFSNDVEKVALAAIFEDLRVSLIERFEGFQCGGTQPTRANHE